MEDAADKSELPTQHKLQEAQRKGQNLRSVELSVLASLLIATGILATIIPVAASEFALRTHQWLHLAASGSPAQALHGLASPWTGVFAVVLVASVVLAVVATASYGGIHFTAFPLKPDFQRLNPARGIRKILSRHTLAEAAKTTFRILMLFLLTGYLAHKALDSLANSARPDTAGAASLLHALCLEALLWLLAMQLPFVLWDLWYARQRYMGQLRMTRSEVRDEHRRLEGDPDIRRKRKRLQSALLAQLQALGNVKDADVVVTNPTHVAVALKYLPQRMDAPQVVCTGSGFVATMIRRLARRHGVPILRSPVLARSLRQDCVPGQEIRQSHRAAVIHVYRWLLATPGRRPEFAR